MDKNIIKQQILEELYALDGGLRDREKELIQVIDQFMALKADFNPDPNFKKVLLDKLLETGKTKTSFGHYGLTFMNKFYYSIGGATLVVALIMGYSFINNFNLMSSNTAKVSIKTVGENAFGDLSLINTGGANPAVGGRGGGGSEMAMSTSARPQSGGGGGGGYAGISMDSKMMPPYQFNQYIYKYVGEPIELADDKINVLQRITGAEIARPFNRLISQLNFPSVDIDAFSNLVLQNISVAEDKEFGYSINFSPVDGSINIYENWQRWMGTSAYPQCQTEDCWNNSRLKASDIPADNELISLAEAFIKQRGIDLSGYGQPSVNNDWRSYPVEPMNQELYIPDVVQVMYPLLIDGKKVYEGSMPIGVYVSINIRVKRVSSVSGLFINNYNSSAYETEKNLDLIMETAKWGGMYSYVGKMEGASLIELELDTPTFEYARIYKPDPNNGSGTELIVPALIFPVKNIPQDGGYYQRYITVPIAKGLIQNSNIGPVPMPLMEKVN